MINLYGKPMNRNDLMRRVGDISQVAGMRHYQLFEGNERDVEAVDFRTGSGFNFTVLIGRGMDIAAAEYRGIPLCWRSTTGEVHSAYYEPQGMGWLRGFYGGLLTTCGMSTVGAPSEDEGETFGLHGRVSHIPARNVWIDSKWEGNSHTLWVQGKIRETSMFGVDLCLTRRIWAKMGESKLHIYDIVENLGYEAAPHMYLYHINIGYPLLDETARLIAPSNHVQPRDAVATAGIDDYTRFQPPTPGYREQVFYHEMIADKDDHVCVAVVNPELELGLYVRYHQSQMPRFVQWKMMGEGTYVLGLEPSNAWVEGRAKERERGTLQYLEAGGRRHYETEIGLLTYKEEILEFEESIAELKSH